MSKKITILLSCALASTLGATTNNLEKIMVTTPTKSSQPLENTTANVTVITADDIEERGYKSVSDALRNVAGIIYTRNGGLGKSTSILLRGFSTSRTLVLVDGVRYNNHTSISGAEFEHIMIDNIDRIEVVKGAQSGIWGADASAGVINIITKKAEKEGVAISLFGEYGSYNTGKYGVNAAYKEEQFDIALNLSRVNSDGFSAKVPAGEDIDKYEDDAYENDTFDVKLGLNVSQKDRVEAFVKHVDARVDYDKFDMNQSVAANDANSSSTSKSFFYGLSYLREEGDNSFKLYANRSTFDRTYPTSTFEGSVDELGFNTQIHYMENGNLTAGLDYKNFTQKDSIDKSYNNQAIFVTNTNSFAGFIAGNTIFSQALRYDKFDAFSDEFTYKVGLKHSYDTIKDFWTSFNYATAYNVPSLSQLYGFGGNSSLAPEKTKSLDVSVNYKGMGVTYFHNSIDEMIEYVFATSSYANVAGESKMQGVEFSYRNSIEMMHLAYGLNYTYLKTEDKDGNELIRRPKNSANMTLDYYGVADTHLGAEIRYKGARKRSPYDVDSGKKDAAYTVVDVKADYSVNAAWSLYLKVDNILDKKYEDIIGFATAERSFYAGFRYKIR